MPACKQEDMLKNSLLLVLASILLRLQLGSQLIQLSLNFIAGEPAEARGRPSLLSLTETVQQHHRLPDRPDPLSWQTSQEE